MGIKSEKMNMSDTTDSHGKGEGMFETQADVKLFDTDAAGILFFANHFRMAHAAYEAFMKSIGWGLNRVINESECLLPLVHAEADYRGKLSLGDEFTISLKAEVGETSFVLSYAFTDRAGDVVAELQTVHVSVDKKTGTKMPLPEGLRAGLSTIE